MSRRSLKKSRINSEHMDKVIDDTPWVFVSHSSADLAKVRRVRNFMEEHGAAPILFHLRSLNEPERFWPLIEEEIAARNFFLLCDSQAARESPWVQREWETVRKIATQRAIRVWRIDLDREDLDFDGLSRFLLNLHVFVVGDHQSAFKVLEDFGYHPLGAVNFSRDGLMCLGDGSRMSDDMIDQLNYGASQGWLLIILSEATAKSKNFWKQLPRPSTQELIMFVLPKGIILPKVAPEIPSEFIVVETSSFEGALIEAAERMLTVGSSL